MSIFKKNPFKDPTKSGGIFNPRIGKIDPHIPNPEDIANQVKREVLDEVPHLIQKGLVDNAEEVIKVLRSVALKNMLHEIEEFGKRKVFSSARIVIDGIKRNNDLVPSDSFNLGGSVAGNGIQINYAGQDHVRNALERARNAINDNRITAEEAKQLMRSFTPESVNFSTGAEVVIALGGGTAVNTTSGVSYKGDKIPELIENFDDIIENTFVTTPKKFIENLVKV